MNAILENILRIYAILWRIYEKKYRTWLIYRVRIWNKILERSQSYDDELLDQHGQELLRHVLGSSWDPAYNQEAEFDVYSIHPALGQSSVFNLAIQLKVLSELWTNIMNFTFHGVPKYTYCIQWPKTTSGEASFPSFQPCVRVPIMLIWRWNWFYVFSGLIFKVQAGNVFLSQFWQLGIFCSSSIVLENDFSN